MNSNLLSKFSILTVISIAAIILLTGSTLSSVPNTQIYEKTVLYDFVGRASEATWRSGAGALPFPGKPDDNRGFALLRQGAMLEDKVSYPVVLETHPQWVSAGLISGTYPQITLQTGSELFVRVGFLDGATGSDGVTLLVYVLEPGTQLTQQSSILINLPATYDGRLDEATISLAPYAGKAVRFQLVVNAGKSSGQDWAVWAEAEIRQQVMDSDQDGIPDEQDNCPAVPNPYQEDVDGDRIGDACDPCDDRDSDADGVKNCLDQCPNLQETVNGYQDEDGCPDTPPTPPTVAAPPTMVVLVDRFSGILEGPIMPGAFDDGDQDGVLNFRDECPNTPELHRNRVFENGCLCIDSDGGAGRAARLEEGSVTARYTGGESGCRDICTEGRLVECSCNPDFEEGRALPENAIITTQVDCATLGPLPTRFSWNCTTGRCIPSAPAIPHFCFSSQGTCADGIQNQGEGGIDCGGICPPCNTRCTTGTRYAPADTPCTTHYPTDPHRVEYYWTDSWLEFPCRTYEVCHPGLDHVIEEAVRCCSIRNSRGGMTIEEMALAEEEEINRMPDPNLCRAARTLTGQAGGCMRCTGFYIIKGLGDYARWMQGYTWLYPEHDIEGIGASPAEMLINVYRTGVCRDYSLAVATLLRKAGYAQNEIGNFCDGAHCYNVVKLEGERWWHVVDTTGNLPGIVPGGFPSGYDYCLNINEANYCYDGIRTTGEVCTGTEMESVDFPPLCQPGTTCGKDVFFTPGWAPTLDQIVGCR